MIYKMMCFKILPGKAGEYEEIHKTQGIPCLQKYGVKVVGAWRRWCGGDTFEFVRIHAFESLAQLEDLDIAMHNDPDYKRYLERIAPLHVDHTTSLLRPTEYSPLQ